MTKQYLFTCDACGREARTRIPEFEDASARGELEVLGWQEIGGNQVCEDCNGEIRRWIRQKKNEQ